jgi:hypothetical protein
MNYRAPVVTVDCDERTMAALGSSDDSDSDESNYEDNTGDNDDSCADEDDVGDDDNRCGNKDDVGDDDDSCGDKDYVGDDDDGCLIVDMTHYKIKVITAKSPSFSASLSQELATIGVTYVFTQTLSPNSAWMANIIGSLAPSTAAEGASCPALAPDPADCG